MCFSIAIRTKSLTCLIVKICEEEKNSVSAASWQAVAQGLHPRPLLYLHPFPPCIISAHLALGAHFCGLSAGEVMQLLVFQAEPAVRVGCL